MLWSRRSGRIDSDPSGLISMSLHSFVSSFFSSFFTLLTWESSIVYLSNVGDKLIRLILNKNESFQVLWTNSITSCIFVTWQFLLNLRVNFGIVYYLLEFNDSFPNFFALLSGINIMTFDRIKLVIEFQPSTPSGCSFGPISTDSRNITSWGWLESPLSSFSRYFFCCILKLILISQALVVLFCQWFVRIKCLATCTEVAVLFLSELNYSEILN